MIVTRTAIVPREVYEEIERKEDDIFGWLKERNEHIQDATESVVLALKAIMQHDFHCRLVKAKGGRSGGDPWVIAHAQTWGAAVVTEETANGPLSKTPKIPDVCADLGIRCMRTAEMLEETNFSFK